MATRSAIIVTLLVFMSTAFAFPPADVRCPSSYVYENGFCYDFQFRPLTWEAANKTCENLGSHLVSIRDIARNAYLKVQGAPQSFWIGLKKDDDGSFEWTDEPHKFDTNGFSDWRNNEPSDAGRCVSLTFSFGENASSRNGGWTVTPCEKQLPSICVIPSQNA